MSRTLPPLTRFVTEHGVQIFRLPVEAFPGNFIVYCYLILGLETPTLIDTGSGFGHSNSDLLDGLRQMGEQFGHTVEPKDIGRIIITHGHVDHFGGVAFMAEQTGALIGIHPLDRRVLTAYEERIVVATKDLRVYLERAGVKPERLQGLLQMYGFAKQHVSSVKVDFALDEDTPVDGLRFIHTPGHCPGQVCILVDDILLSADHILARITPHQAPESITNHTGLTHYLEALRKIERMPDLGLALGGHEQPVEDVYARIADIHHSHERKLTRVLDALNDIGAPATISDLSKAIYPDRHGYDVLLAIEEVGAHVEYLYEHGELAISNLAEVEQADNPPLLYTRA